ncbi:MAG: DEAD/DEAH box helicase [Nitriliruptoraceae bacterium]
MVLDRDEATDGGLVHLERLPARRARTVALPSDLPADLQERLRTDGITQLWSHQAEALELARAGRHLVLATGTASGKSLAYQLPALERLHADDRSVVLHLSPTKALAHDQLRALRRFRLPWLRAAVLDGDTPREERAAVRRTANWILTNPDLLHASLLGDHQRWADVLHRCQVVLIDESHVARGVFGSHVALVLRRLRRLLERYGADPLVLLASATIGNPGEHAASLTGLDITEVVRDGAPRGPVHLGLWLPPLEEDGQRRRSTLRETGELLAAFVGAEVQTLAFTRSRKGAEVIAAIARDRVRLGAPVPPPAEPDEPATWAASGRDHASTNEPSDAMGAVSPDRDRAALADRIAAYRAGYLAEDRRVLEAALRDGTLLGVAATEALELGIDVAGLDAVLLAGWPGTTAAFWQRIGRAGRRGEASVAVLVAQEDPLDHYLVLHPRALLTRDPEDAVIDPTNPYLLAPHLRCACQEAPLTDAEAVRWFGASAPALLAEDVASGRLRRRDDRHFWTGRGRAAAEVGLRSTGGEPIRIVDTATGQVIGDVDEARAHRQVHPGAIHLHQGRVLEVAQLDLDRRLALVADAPTTELTTRPRVDTDVRVLDTAEQASWAEVEVAVGRVEVTTRVTGYEVLRVGSGEVLERVDLELPPTQLRTVASWWAIPEDSLDAVGLDPARVPGSLHAAEHAAIGMLPLLALCDRWDLGGLSTALHPDTGRPTVVIYDGVPGGAGLAERSFRRLQEHLRLTRGTVATCRCADGCPSCVQSPKCGNGNEPLDRSGAVAVLELLLARAP